MNCPLQQGLNEKNITTEIGLLYSTGPFGTLLVNNTPYRAMNFDWIAAEGYKTFDINNNGIFADFNNDGRPDAVGNDFGNYLQSEFSIWLNDTTLANTELKFAEPQSFPQDASQKQINFFLAGDVNSDGKIDLITATSPSYSDEYFNQISVHFNTTASGSNQLAFSSPQVFATGITGQSLISGDFNHDNKIDLAMIDVTNSNVSLLINQTPVETFTSNWQIQSVNVGQNNQYLATGDVNQDGKTDLLVANQIVNPSTQQLSPNIAVMINNTQLLPATNGTSGDDTLIGTAEIDTIAVLNRLW